MNQTADKIVLKDNQTKTRKVGLNKFTLEPVRGGKFQYILIGDYYKYTLECYYIFFYNFSISNPWRVSYIIQFILDHLDPTLVDHLSPYLSAYPIRHSLWLLVSYDSQGSTVQGFSPHKCGQKSSCSAFNAMTTALSQIFPSSYSSSMFVMLAPSSGVSRKVILSDRICTQFVLGLSEEIFLLGTPFPTFPLEYYLSRL